MLAGEEYGTGSSARLGRQRPEPAGRARRGGAQSFERIHRSNLVGMGILPCQFQGADSIASLGLDGSERFDIVGLEAGLQAQQQIEMHITRANGQRQSVMLLARVDTPIEAQYLAQGGILAFVLRKLMNNKKAAHA